LSGLWGRGEFCFQRGISFLDQKAPWSEVNNLTVKVYTVGCQWYIFEPWFWQTKKVISLQISVIEMTRKTKLKKNYKDTFFYFLYHLNLQWNASPLPLRTPPYLIFFVLSLTLSLLFYFILSNCQSTFYHWKIKKLKKKHHFSNQNPPRFNCFFSKHNINRWAKKRTPLSTRRNFILQIKEKKTFRNKKKSIVIIKENYNLAITFERIIFLFVMTVVVITFRFVIVSQSDPCGKIFIGGDRGCRERERGREKKNNENP